MATTVLFDALPASVRALLFQSTQLEGRNKIDSTHPQMAFLGAEFPLSGLLFPGFIFGPVAVLGLWIYARGPFRAAEHYPVMLSLASLWLFAAIAMMVVELYSERHERLVDGDYLYAGTVLRLAGRNATIFELAPTSHAKFTVQSYQHSEIVHRGGKRYLQKSTKSSSWLVITAIATDGTQFVFRRDGEKIDGPTLERPANERFARWHQARARNDHATMSALDPFAQCYAQRTLETREPQGPHRVLTPVPVKIALFVAVTALGLMPALYNALFVE